MQVKSKVQEILGLTYEHFTQSVLLPQGRFSEFLHAKPADRQGLLVELLAFGVYESVGQQARRRAEVARERLRVAESARQGLADASEQAEKLAAQTGASADRAGPGGRGTSWLSSARSPRRRNMAAQQAQAAASEAAMLAGGAHARRGRLACRPGSAPPTSLSRAERANGIKRTAPSRQRCGRSRHSATSPAPSGCERPMRASAHCEAAKELAERELAASEAEAERRGMNWRCRAQTRQRPRPARGRRAAARGRSAGSGSAGRRGLPGLPASGHRAPASRGSRRPARGDGGR